MNSGSRIDLQVEIKRAAQKEIGSLSLSIKPRVDAAIRALGENPRPRGSKKLEGTKRNLYRIKVAVYRVIYEIRDELLLVVVVRARHRRDAYRLPFPT